MSGLSIGSATRPDGPNLRRAVVELQEHERRLSPTRLPGKEIGDAYLKWIRRRVANDGIVLIAESDDTFAGFASGWIEEERNLVETADSNRFGYVSDICVTPEYRGRRIAQRLLDALALHFRRADVARMRIAALAANEHARVSYERSGFAEYEIIYEKLIGAQRA
jgi:ribosomal protein S18 acetylase RimI-like enzyme